MGHPFAAHRQGKVEKSRVGHITRGYASGGAVHSDEKQDHKLIRKMVGEMVPDGDKSKHRADRPHRAKGGRVKGNSRTIVNVITGGNPATGTPPPLPSAPPMGIAPAGAMPPPRPPMAPPPGAGPGMPPPMPMRAKGGRVNSGTAVYEEGKRNGTKVQHNPGKTDTPKALNRPRVVTFNTGGGVKSFKVGGRVEASDKVSPATKLPGGAGGGEARLKQAHRQGRQNQ